ncbi:MAG: hypothetical protein NTZ74_00765 [Chloroflexi bacterium]|nr:hypothetical protein [Chloroflexota bacterium]
MKTFYVKKESEKNEIEKRLLSKNSAPNLILRTGLHAAACTCSDGCTNENCSYDGMRVLGCKFWGGCL